MRAKPGQMYPDDEARAIFKTTSQGPPTAAASRRRRPHPQHWPATPVIDTRRSFFLACASALVRDRVPAGFELWRPFGSEWFGALSVTRAYFLRFTPPTVLLSTWSSSHLHVVVLGLCHLPWWPTVHLPVPCWQLGMTWSVMHFILCRVVG